MSGLPPISGAVVYHGHHEGEPCNSYCHYRIKFWRGIRAWFGAKGQLRFVRRAA